MHQPPGYSSVPNALCQPRDKVTSHTTMTYNLNFIFKFLADTYGSFTIDQNAAHRIFCEQILILSRAHKEIIDFEWLSTFAHNYLITGSECETSDPQ